MRAARVLDMLLILQRRGRCTATALAEELEVSARTILRDVEALSEAGVPIYTEQGPAGGIELLDGFQTNLTGLTADEARNLFLVGQPQVAHRLGVTTSVRATTEKLLNALPAPLAAEAASLTEWFLHDPDPWQGSSLPHGELRRIAGAIARRRHVELMFASDTPRTVRPLGLVLKAGQWQLVHLEDGAQVLTLEGLRSTRLTNRPFVAPADFDLESAWRDYLRSRPDDLDDIVVQS